MGFYGCCGIGGILAQDFIMDFVEEAAKQNPPPAGQDPTEVLRVVMDASGQYLPVQIGTLVIQILLAFCFIVAGIMAVSRAAFGRSMLAYTYMAAAIISVVAAGVNSYVGFRVAAKVSEAELGAAGQQQVTSQYIGLGVGAVFAIGFSILFVVAYYLLSTPKVKSWYEANLRSNAPRY